MLNQHTHFVGRVPSLLGMRLVCSAATAALSAVLLISCQTKPEEVPAPLSNVTRAVTATVSSVEVGAKSPRTIEFSFQVQVSNPNTGTAEITAIDSHLTVEGEAAAAYNGPESVAVAGGRSTLVHVAYAIDMSNLYRTLPGLTQQARAHWNFAVDLSVQNNEGATYTVHATQNGELPIVQEPTIRVRALRIKRYDLIETKLDLVLAIHNPNMFAVNLHSLQYQFSAEGRIWGDGTRKRVALVGPGQTAEVLIPLRLNFIDMGRHVLDIVASLGVVHYSFLGKAGVTTPTTLLPEFPIRFDRDGQIRVQK